MFTEGQEKEEKENYSLRLLSMAVCLCAWSIIVYVTAFMITFLQNQKYSHSTLRHIQQLPQFWCLLLGSIKLTTFMINNYINLLLSARAAEIRLFVKIVMLSAGKGFNFACSFLKLFCSKSFSIILVSR